MLFEALGNCDVDFRLAIQSRSKTGAPSETRKPHRSLVTPNRCNSTRASLGDVGSHAFRQFKPDMTHAGI